MVFYFVKIREAHPHDDKPENAPQLSMPSIEGTEDAENEFDAFPVRVCVIDKQGHMIYRSSDLSISPSEIDRVIRSL